MKRRTPDYHGTFIHPEPLKARIREYWSEEPCATRGVAPDDRAAFFDQIEAERYEWEPHIPGFARWERGRGKKVLEVGVGAGTDLVNWARHGALLSGVDLTQPAIDLSRERLALEGMQADLRVCDAEHLPFEDDTFDVVYSYGVLMVTPDTERAIAEVHRVLKPGGVALLMLYNLNAWTTLNLWAYHALLKLRPWKSPRWVIYNYLESPGMKAYTEAETRELLRAFSSLSMSTQLLGGDLLQMRPSKRYAGALPRLLFALYPRPLVRRIGQRFGFGRLIEATK